MNFSERVKLIRNSTNLNQNDFAKSLGMTRDSYANFEYDRLKNDVAKEPTIKAICREYGINETWLRTGEGDMRILPEDETAAIVAEILEDDSSDFYKAVVEVIKKYQQLDPKSQRVIDQLCSDFIASKKQP